MGMDIEQDGVGRGHRSGHGMRNGFELWMAERAWCVPPHRACVGWAAAQGIQQRHPGQRDTVPKAANEQLGP